MKGKLKKQNEEWVVEFEILDVSTYLSYMEYVTKTLPVTPEDSNKLVNEDVKKEVSFEIINLTDDNHNKKMYVKLYE